MHLNNACWDEIESGHVEDPRRLLYRAYAAAYHWMVAGGVIEQCRAEHLLSRAASSTGDAALARHHALRCRALLSQDPPGAEPWDEVFAGEALARAYAAAGDVGEGTKLMQSAEQALNDIDDPEEREIARSVLSTGPWFGLR